MWSGFQVWLSKRSSARCLVESPLAPWYEMIKGVGLFYTTNCQNPGPRQPPPYLCWVPYLVIIRRQINIVSPEYLTTLNTLPRLGIPLKIVHNPTPCIRTRPHNRSTYRLSGEQEECRAR